LQWKGDNLIEVRRYSHGVLSSRITHAENRSEKIDSLFSRDGNAWALVGLMREVSVAGVLQEKQSLVMRDSLEGLALERYHYNADGLLIRRAFLTAGENVLPEREERRSYDHLNRLKSLYRNYPNGPLASGTESLYVGARATGVAGVVGCEG
jgi:hypothetical protein